MVSPQLAEGLVMGALGYTMTFAIIIILSIAMYVTSKIISKIEKPVAVPAPKPEVTPTPTVTAPELSPEEAVAVAAAIHAFLTEAIPSMPAAAPATSRGWGPSPWVVKARLDTRVYLGDFAYIRERRKSGGES